MSEQETIGASSPAGREPVSGAGREPVRWLDDPDADAALRADLIHGASATAAGFDYGASLTALRGAIAAQTSALPVAASAGSALSIGVKVAVGVLLAGGIAMWAARGDADADHDLGRDPRDIAQARLDPDAGAAAIEASPTAAPIEVGAAQQPELRPAMRVEPAAAIDPATGEPIPQGEPTTPGEPSPQADDDGSNGKVVADASDRSKPRSRRPETGMSETALPGTATPISADPEAIDGDRYVREAKLVAQARRALADDPARALELTDELEREFPNGLLEEERRALAIRALTRLRRGDEARTAAKSFLVKFPDGPHAAAVRRAIDGGSDTAP
jgi:hypothetical protein